MTDSQALMRYAAKVGHRSDAGHRCHNISALLQVEPEHPDHARRRLAILAVQTAGLARAVSASSHHGGTEYRDLAQKTTEGRS